MAGPVVIVHDKNQAFVDDEKRLHVDPLAKNFYHEVSDGGIANQSVVHKFGRANVGTTFAPLSFGGVYMTPQVGSETTLRIKAGGNAADDAAGVGAQEVTLIGLDNTGAEISESLATAGASASASTLSSFLRLYRWYVSGSGRYATVSPALLPSAVGNIVIENTAGTQDWSTMDSTDFHRGQSEIGCFTIPLGFHGHVETIHLFIDSRSTTDFLFLQRQNILQTAAPYSAMREVISGVGLVAETVLQPKTPLPGATPGSSRGFPPLTDLIFLAKVAASTGDVIVDFEVILEKDVVGRTFTIPGAD